MLTDHLKSIRERLQLEKEKTTKKDVPTSDTTGKGISTVLQQEVNRNL